MPRVINGTMCVVKLIDIRITLDVGNNFFYRAKATKQIFINWSADDGLSKLQPTIM